MNLTDEEQRIVDDAERLWGHPLPRFSTPLGYVAGVFGLSGSVLGLWNGRDVSLCLVWAALACGFIGFSNLRYRYYKAMSLISKLQGERLSTNV